MPPTVLHRPVWWKQFLSQGSLFPNDSKSRHVNKSQHTLSLKTVFPTKGLLGCVLLAKHIPEIKHWCSEPQERTADHAQGTLSWWSFKRTNKAVTYFSLGSQDLLHPFLSSVFEPYLALPFFFCFYRALPFLKCVTSDSQFLWALAALRATKQSS